jgi:hypothetical protein
LLESLSLYADTLCAPTGDVSGEQTFAPGANPTGMAFKDFKDGTISPVNTWWDATARST